MKYIANKERKVHFAEMQPRVSDGGMPSGLAPMGPVAFPLSLCFPIAHLLSEQHQPNDKRGPFLLNAMDNATTVSISFLTLMWVFSWVLIFLSTCLKWANLSTVGYIS